MAIASPRILRTISRRTHLAAGILAVTVAATSCVHDVRAPKVNPRGTLALGQDSSSVPASERPFGVVFGSPKGATDDPSEISLVFNRPMVPLNLAGNEPPSPASVFPAVPGQWQWIGTSALRFSPSQQLPRATTFTVTVPAGTKALAGDRTTSPYKLQFETARPRLSRVTSSDPSDALTPKATFSLWFNQPVADGAISRAISLHVDSAKGPTIPFTIEHPTGDSAPMARLRPSKRLPLAHRIVVFVSDKLQGTEGPLLSGKTKTRSFATYGPLTVANVTCDDGGPRDLCDSRSGFELELSNPVKFKDLRAALTITPSVKLKSWADDDDMTRYFSFGGDFKPGRTYTVRIRRGVVDSHGQRLAHSYTRRLRYDDLWPEADIGVSGSYFEPKTSRAVPIASVNLRSFELMTRPLRLSEVGQVKSFVRSNDTFAKLAGMSGAKVKTIHPAAARNHAHNTLVDPARILGGKDKRGPVLIATRYTSRPGTSEAQPVTEVHIVQVTDLAISAKISRFGSLVWVTRMSNGQPVADAEVFTAQSDPNDHPKLIGKTDKDGILRVGPDARLLADGNNSPRLIVKSGDDWAYRDMNDATYPWRFGADSSPFGDPSNFGMLFTERGLYRPGDSVKIKGILRREIPHGTETPAGSPATVTVRNAEGDVFFKKPLKLSAFGTFHAKVRLPSSSPLGSYNIGVFVGKNAGIPDASSYFEVAEYRPSQFKTSSDLGQRSYVRGDKVTCSGHGEYLFGGGMASADARATITHGPSWFSVPKTDGFTTSDDAFSYDDNESSLGSSELLSDESKLDSHGNATFSANLTLPGMKNTERVTCEVEVTDLNRQSVASSSTAIVHPAAFYVGLNSGEDGFAKAGDRLSPKIIAVTPSGRRVGGVPVTVELIQRRWVTAREAAGKFGVHSESHRVDERLGQCEVHTSGSPVSCNLTIPKAGYFILRAKSHDKRGNKIAASSYIYATGDGASGWADGDEMAVELVPDRTSYEVGQTARILIKSPFKKADALITVEREGIYTHKRKTLYGTMPTINIPITADMAPNAYVSVVLLRGRSSNPPSVWNAPDVGAPAYRVGYTSLQLNPEAKRLRVKVKPSKVDFRPGQQVTVDLNVADRRGKGAATELTVYAVDEGVLMLSGYKTPDPIPVFTRPRPLRNLVVESRDSLAHLTINPFQSTIGKNKGAESGGGGGSGRKDFRQSAYFNPSVLTDASGHARVSFKLPESLTTYRIMAVAVGHKDRFGFGQSSVTTSLPLMARPAFPRFVRAGDEIDAGVVVTSKTLPNATIEVKANVKGWTLVGEAAKRIELGKGQSKEVRFHLRADHVGKASATFSVQGGGEHDKVTVTKKVKIPTTMEAVALYGQTRSASGEKLGDLKAIRGDVGSLKVSVSSSALVGLSGSMEQLVEYPYECTEQLSSRLMPVLAMRDLAKAFDLPMPKNADKFVSMAVGKIVRRQHGNGGFGLWDDSPHVNPWASAYALWVLDMAKKKGAHVPARTLERGKKYLRQYVSKFDKYKFYGAATSAFMLDVLAEVGAPDVGYMNSLFDKRDQMPLFARALLAHAMTIGHGDEKARDELLRDLETHVRVSGNKATIVENQGRSYAPLMDSSNRTTAFVLRTMLAAKPQYALASRLVKSLLDERKGGTWRNTQETAFALLALDDYRKAQESDKPDFVAGVWLGNEQLLDQPFSSRTVKAIEVTLPTSKMKRAGGSTLAFQLGGHKTGTLFYESRLRYARTKPLTTPIDRGFYVGKAMRVVTAQSLKAALRNYPTKTTKVPLVKGGELVLVDLLVVAQQPQDYVVVDDPIPAGLEAIDSNLATSAASLNVDFVGGSSGWGSGDPAMAGWYRKELRDDRAVYFVDHMAAGLYHYRYLARASTVGRFVMPATRVEAMYEPEVFGRTGDARLEIQAK